MSNQWEGQIYNSEDGNTYSASITLSDPNTLRVQGCVLGFLCGGENWTRVEGQDTFGSRATTNSAKVERTQGHSSQAPCKYDRGRLTMCAHGSRALRGFPMSAG